MLLGFVIDIVNKKKNRLFAQKQDLNPHIKVRDGV